MKKKATPFYTRKELREFDNLTARLSSRDQLKRIAARLALPGFIEQHGKETCAAMFEELLRRDGVEGEYE